jgi:hypothetical protein
MELWWEFQKFSKNYGTFLGVLIFIFMRVKNSQKGDDAI